MDVPSAFTTGVSWLLIASTAGMADAIRRHGCWARFIGFPLTRNRLEARLP